MGVKKKSIRFVDLFSGIGALRIGFEKACSNLGVECECVFSSEIKPHAIKVYKDNFKDAMIEGDITKIDASNIPDFDFLLAGFPCQTFSSAGNRLGFQDTRGTLFFDIERILKAKKPYGFILENVEGLSTHDKGRTLNVMLKILNDNLGYRTNYKLLNSKYFGLAQDRKRIFIVGTKDKEVSLEGFRKRTANLSKFLQKGMPTLKTQFTELLLSKFSIEELYGKSIKDKRGGKNNIHSWDIELKGRVTKKQKALLDIMMKRRRNKKWAMEWGIEWMDGMPLTEKHIATFFPAADLKDILTDLVNKRYLKYEPPKVVVQQGKIRKRQYDFTKEKGYNIVTGKLSFEISKVLDPESVAPTLVATDISKLAVPDGNGLRRLTLKECLLLFGFPESFKMNVNEEEGFNLLGNTVAVPVAEEVSERAVEGFVRS